VASASLDSSNGHGLTVKSDMTDLTIDLDVARIRDAAQQINVAAVIDSSGRAGNLLFLTLFDTHPQVACCPIVQYTYSYILAEFGSEQVIDAARARAFITQRSYFRLLYNAPVGSNGDLLTRMGGDANAPLDRERLRRLIDAYFEIRKEVTRRD